MPQADTGGLERLEARVLLAGDHFSFNPALFPAHPASDFMFDAEGRAALNGIIQAPGETGPGGTVPATGDDDMFRFIAPPGANFVSVLADTVNVVGGSMLNSRVRIYSSTGDLIATGTNNGVLSTTRPGVANDGWVGFIATPGETYYVRVDGELGTTGGYIIRVNAQTTTLNVTTTHTNESTVGEAFAPEDPMPDPIDPRAQHILFPQDERIYRVTAPDTAPFDSLATASVRGDRANPPPGGVLDTHLEVYDSQGNLIASDIETGFLNDAFVTWRSRPGETYYIRVRGDDLRDPNNFPSVGTFQLRVDLSAFEIPIDPVTRRGQLTQNLTSDEDTMATLANVGDTGLFRFTAQGTGPAIITVLDTGPVPHDVAVRVFNYDGTFRAYNNNFNGDDAQVEIPVIGGETYFIVVDGFPDLLSGPFDIWIEAQHTTNNTDDHINRPVEGTTDERRRQFALATPLRFQDPRLFFESDFLGETNPILDRTYVQDAIATGRINREGDSDLFQFTAPVDMLSDYAGNNDDAGSALWAGGQFNTTDPDSLWPRVTGALGLWDADDWWFTGRQGEGPDGVQYGFTPNTLAQAEIYTLLEYDPDGNGPASPRLYVGGDFTLVLPNPLDPASPIEFRNLVYWSFNPLAGAYVWSGAGDPDGAVRAMARYSTGQGGGGTQPSLVIGGDFTTIGGVPADRLAISDGVAFQQLGTGLGLPNGSVRALAVWDPPDPGTGRTENLDENPPLFEVPDPEDPPNTLFIGGTAGGVAFLRHWDGESIQDFSTFGAQPVTDGPFPAPAIVGSSINAIIVYQGVDPDGNGPEQQPEPTLIIAGEFTSIGGVVSPNIIKFGRVADPEAGDADADPDAPNYRPRLLWEAMDGGTDGPVNALAVWDQPDVLGAQTPLEPILVVGGAFTTAGGGFALNLATWNGQEWDQLGGGVDGPVFSLTVSVTAGGEVDVQEPGIPVLGVDDPQQVLYIGGAFTTADPLELEGPATPAQNIVQRGWEPVIGGFAPFWRPLKSGTNGTVFALQMFDDQNPQVDNSGLTWDRNDRPGTRMNIVLSPTTESFLNAGLRVYDSNFNLVYPTNADGLYNVNLPEPGSTTPLPANNRIVPPPFVDPAGMIDPSMGGPNVEAAIQGIKLWGGETYYIEVIGLSGTGRYTLSVTIDAMPPDLDGDGQPDSPVAVTWAEVPNLDDENDQDAFGRAAALSPSLITGDAFNYMPLPNQAYNRRTNKPQPAGFQVQNFNELAAIETITDTDLYTFVAESSGWAEVRLNTLMLRRDPSLEPSDEDGDQFTEFIVDTATGEVVSETDIFRVYNSNLDGRIVIYNNDFEPVAVSDSHPGIAGEFTVQRVGTAFRLFTERDPKVGFRVTAGERYFIKVESAQKAAYEEDPDLVDWRHAIGSYELILDTMPFLNHDDDHGPTGGGAFYPTPIPIGGHDPVIDGEPLNGRGSVFGEIRHTTANPADMDSFVVIPAASGVVTATLTATDPSEGLVATLAVLTELGQPAAPQGQTTPGGSTTVTWVATQGETFYIFVEGVAGTEGSYRLDIVGQPYVDDHADYYRWAGATRLELDRFFGIATAPGVIESPGDTDLFYFDAEAYEVATVKVDSNSATLNPHVLVYEIGEDGAGNPTFLLINLSVGGGLPGQDTSVTFSTTPGRRYYFVVAGVDPNVDMGAYTLEVNLIPTDDHPDIGSQHATEIAISYDQNFGVGTGSTTGRLEREQDTDLFVFTAPIRGDVEVTVETTEGNFPIVVTLFDSAGNVLDTVTGPAGAAAISLLDVLRTGQNYFIGVAPDAGIDPADFPVAYSVAVSTSPTDDHADAGDFANATQIVLSTVTHLGSMPGAIVPFTDTDLFYFDTIAAGPVVVEITTIGSNLDPQARIFDADGVQIAFSAGTTDAVVISLTATAAGQRYYVLVEPDANAASLARTGEYVVRVSNIPSGGGPGQQPDDHANQGDFEDATRIALETRTGDGSASGVINFLGDTDLFVFTTIAAGDVRINLSTPQGSPLDGAIRVFNAAREQIRFDAAGIPGVTAATSFAAGANETYYVLVEQVGPNLGGYTLAIDSAPPVFYLYYPEGYSASTIDEFVPIVNPNNFDVTYTVYLRYEVGERDQIVAQGVIPANSRGGITISNPTGGAPNPLGIRLDEPYAIEIQSSGQLGATMSHYDFGVTTGESFTEQLSTLWTFAEAHKDAAVYRDFLVYYNPNNVDTNVTVTLIYDDGSVTTFTRTLGALRRGGVNFNEDGAVTRSGVFSVKVESDAPIVAALTSYDIQNGRGFALLGDPNGGSVTGVVPSISTGSGVESAVAIYNPGSSSVAVTIRATYQRADLPDLVRTITVAPGGRFSASMAQLGLIDSQVAGLRYEATAPVTFSTHQYRVGDGDATAAATRAATTALIGDAFVNPAVAGITYIEELALYNPASIDVNITITFLFSDGTVGQYVDPSTGQNFINLRPDSFGFIRIDQQPAILSRPDLAFFSIRLEAPTPFVSAFNHYDLFLNGGWGTLPAPVGLTVPLSRI